jgi:hypothetical protein
VVAAVGIKAPMVVGVAVFAGPLVPWKDSLLLGGVGSKFVPVIVTASNWATILGDILMMLGRVLPTTKGVALVAEPLGEVTAIGPLVAPTGTVTVSPVGEAVRTVADTPLNVTVFWLGVELKPVPDSVTTDPTGLRFGVNSTIDTAPAACRVIERRFPTESYV